jgi:hypothetical protein
VAQGGSRRRRLRVVPSIVLTLVIILVPAGVYLWGRHSSVFAIRHVVVSGAHNVSKDRALTLLDRRYLGTNLFGVSTGGVRHTLAPLKYLADVRIDRSFPDTLRVRVIEHRPLAYLLAAGKWYVVGDDGYVIAFVAAAPPVSAGASPRPSPSSSATPSPTPTTTTSSSPHPTPGASASTGTGASSSDGPAVTVGLTDPYTVALRSGPPDVRKRPLLPALGLAQQIHAGETLHSVELRDALALLAALPASQYRAAAAVDRNGDGSLQVVRRDRLVIVFGDASRLADKMLALQVVLARYEMGRVKPTMIDVAIADRPLARPVLK